MVIVRVTGHHPTTPIDVYSGVSTPNGTTNIVIPTITPTGGGRLLLQMVARINNAVTFTKPASATSRYANNAASQSYGDAGGDEVVGASATGTRTWVPSSSTGQAFGFMVAIAPAVNPDTSAGFLGLI